MLNEIILNGTSSSTLQGLIIQSLPSISKPLMRSKKEEIDGRDGDIITPLGYSSYDKTFSIGLSYNYDINAIIKFFDSQGTVTFSNEPDKYYNYQILDQIDFDKLLRFKTATVKMHIQPFKYSVNEMIPLVFTRNRINFGTYSQTTSGVTVNMSENLQESSQEIIVTGNGVANFYIPIQTLNLTPDRYALSAYAIGTGVEYCTIKLINGNPNTFFGEQLTLEYDKSKTTIQNIGNNQTYNYIYLSVNSNTELNLTFNVSFNTTGNTSFEITNSGNYISKPTLEIWGNDIVELHLNNELLFKIDLADDGYIVIDTFNMDSSKNAVKKNRSVTGNYENFELRPGKNEITYSGNASDIIISNYSRWI